MTSRARVHTYAFQNSADHKKKRKTALLAPDGEVMSIDLKSEASRVFPPEPIPELCLLFVCRPPRMYVCGVVSLCDVVHLRLLSEGHTLCHPGGVRDVHLGAKVFAKSSLSTKEGNNISSSFHLSK